MRLVLIRHGATVAWPGTCIGHTDVPLSADGAGAIQSVADQWNITSVGSPARILSSDLQRAHGSALPFAARFELSVETDARLREMNFGDWDGREWNEIDAADGARLRAWTDCWMEASPPNGERVADLVTRAAEVLDELRRTEPHNTILIVTHAGWIRAALTLLLDKPVLAMIDWPTDHACATIVDVTDNGAALIVANVAHLHSAASHTVEPSKVSRTTDSRL
jgi:alpha-ribazole phosphatase